MKDLQFMCVVPSTLRWWWEIAVMLTNFKEMDYSKRSNILIFENEGNLNKGSWEFLEEKFPESKFFYYQDNHKVGRILNSFNYSPLIRPYCLREHFYKYPELEHKVIFYHDSDILFTKKLDFHPLVGDDVCYLSWTGNTREDGTRYGNYLNAEYFDGKKKDVEEKTLKGYEKIDVLKECLEYFSLSRGIAEKNNDRTGGAQYLLKNINSSFWNDVFEGSIFVRMHLRQINQRFFESENKGFQSWCADMWALLWTLWKTNHQTFCPPILDFMWATDRIENWDKYYIYHNAGITSDSKFKTGRGENKEEIESPAFFKTNYTNKMPFDDVEYLNSIINNPLSRQFANSKYVEYILKTKQFLSL